MAGRTPVLFSTQQQQQLFDALRAAADEFHYRLIDASIEPWHLHWIVEHSFDPVPTMVGRLKTRMRQALNIGRIWTEGYYDSRLFERPAVQLRQRYIAGHAGCRMTNGVIV
jgi:REP element-mobilizing transposase RayT